MKIVTKIMTVVISVMLTFAIGTTNAHAATHSGKFGGDGDNLTWEYDDSTKTLTISGTGEMEDWQAGHLTPWVSFQTEITTVVITDGVTSIGAEAFGFYYHNLSTVNIADSVTDIRFHAFHGADNLKNIVLPENLITIGPSAFYGSGLTDIVIPDSVKTIGDNAFEKAFNLKNIVIGKNVETIEAYAFSSTAIEEITIPRSVKKLEDLPFNYCNNLAKIIYEGTEEQWYALTDGVILGIEPSQVTFVFQPKWYVAYDLNGGTTTNFTPTTITVDDGFESLIPAWDEIKSYIHAPAGKEYAGVEVNGKKYNVGDNFKVKEDVLIKLLWNDINNGTPTDPATNNTQTGDNTFNNATSTNSANNSPQTGDTIMSNIIALLLSSVGILGGITYLLWRKRKLD